MATFEYEISRHSSEDFREVGYFCTAGGECSLGQVPNGELAMLTRLLNERGKEGWQLIQLQFGKDGALAFWKREK